jgi:uncharacterized BrkB/YihY/UPF0761 family membrane protein
MSQSLEESEPIPTTADQAPDPVPEPSRRERLRATVARLKDQAVDLLSGLEGIRPESRTVSAGFLIFERDREFPTSLLTGALAARVVIFLIPFLALIVLGIGLGVDFAEVSAAEAAQEAGLPGMFAAAAEDSAAASGQFRFTGLLFTSFAMVWAANALGKTMRLTTSVVWRTPRGRVQRRWLVPLSVIAFSLLALGANGVAHQLNRPGALDDILRLIIELVLIAGLWAVASRFLPHDPEANRWRDFVPGALLMAIAVVTLRAAIIFYLAPKWATLSERYGEIGFVLVLLSFAYIIGFAAIASAHVNSAAFSTRRDPTQVAPEDRTSPLLDLLREERETWRRQAES